MIARMLNALGTMSFGMATYLLFGFIGWLVFFGVLCLIGGILMSRTR